jgi:hypothetical protein
MSPPFWGVESDEGASVAAGATCPPQPVSTMVRTSSAYKSIFRFMMFFSFGKLKCTKPQSNLEIAENAKYLKLLYK